MAAGREFLASTVAVKGGAQDPVRFGLRRSSGPAAYTASHFAFLNRAAGPAWQRVRDLLGTWYADHPDSDGVRERGFANPISISTPEGGGTCTPSPCFGVSCYDVSAAHYLACLLRSSAVALNGS